MFKVIIIGGEDTENYDFFKTKCIHLLSNKAKSGEGITIFTTGDRFVEKFATRYGIDTKRFSTYWDVDGKEALKNRNERILKDSDGLIYFDTGKKDLEILYSTAKSRHIPSKKIPMA